MLWATFVMAVREIIRNTMRSALTMLGVVIGVAAVIAMVTIAEGATSSVTSELSALGDNLLILVPQSTKRGSSSVRRKPLKAEDAVAIQREIPGVENVAPTDSASAVVVYGNVNWPTSITGTTPAFFDVRKYDVDEGRAFTSGDSGRSVCVLGPTTKKELFGIRPAVGQTIRLGKVPCTVIGILEAKGTSNFGANQDDIILMPLNAFQRRIGGTRDVATIFITVANNRPTSAVRKQVEGLMRQRRRIAPGADNDFAVHDMQEIVETVAKTSAMLTGLLGAIAAVSLLVGGIGIMNIMLVSVTERTREIGIRLAVGALAGEVLLQFLIESTVLSTLGGVIGILLGLAGAYGVTNALDFPFDVQPQIVIIAFFFSALVGIGFGFLPARKAARLKPIEALRHE